MTLEGIGLHVCTRSVNNVFTLASVLPNPWFCNQGHMAFKPIMPLNIADHKTCCYLFQMISQPLASLLFNPRTLMVFQLHPFNMLPPQGLQELLDSCLLYGGYGKPAMSPLAVHLGNPSDSATPSLPHLFDHVFNQMKSFTSCYTQGGGSILYYSEAFSNLSKIL